MSLYVVPITLEEANHFVGFYHRHLGSVAGSKFCIAAADPLSEAAYAQQEPEIVGVLIAGRPVSRHLDNGWTLEVNRCCTNGARNACSLLYASAWRAARALGYTKLITYTLASEPGSSLRAAGFRVVGEVRGRSWDTPSRPRVDTSPRQNKLRWELSA